ncbi:MAG: ice-binding family protein [Georgfuchsia sp.]
MAFLLSAWVAGCGGGGDGGRDPILGSGDVTLAPTVTALAPLANATGVPISTKIITAAFSKAMDPATLTTASFTLACGAPGTTGVVGSPKTQVTGGGTVTYLAAGNVATLPLPAATDLPASADCTATITTAVQDTTGTVLAVNYVWTFATGVTPDTTRPRVTLTVPATTLPLPTPTTGAIANAAITAVFTEDMAPASITTAGTFTVTCVAPCVSPSPVGGAATYAVGSRTATYTPTAVLSASTTYTATVTTAATDLALNALAGNQAALPAASNYIWTFTTAAAVIPPAPITVISTTPADVAPDICPTAAINATFNASAIRMDDPTVAANFTVTGPGATVVTPSSVVLDVPTGRIATFTPLAVLPVGLYTANITGGPAGAKDLAIPTANTMASDFTWTFTVVSCVTPPPVSPFPLGSAATFGVFGGSAGMTNQGLDTVINGDIGTTAISTAVTGFHDATPNCIYTETGSNVGTVNGGIFTAPPPPTVGCPTEGTGTAAPPTGTFGIATVARADALTAYNALVATPVVGTPVAANLSGLTVPPGVYVAPGGSFLIQDGLPGLAGDLTLDGLGDANAVWVFKTATTLTVGGPGAAFPRSVKLINGAQAKNVFWQVGSFATINEGGGGTMEGTIISQAGASFSTPGNVTPVILNGRVLSLGASVTVVNTVINVPAP